MTRAKSAQRYRIPISVFAKWENRPRKSSFLSTFSESRVPQSQLLIRRNFRFFPLSGNPVMETSITQGHVPQTDF